MRHQIRSVVVVGTTALLLATGAGAASAQGSVQFTLPFPVDIPGLASLATEALSPHDGDAIPETLAQGNPIFAMPAEWAQSAFEGRVVAGVNEARTAVGAERLVTDPVLADAADERAAELAAGDSTIAELDVPGEAATLDRTVLELPADASPQDVLTAMISDTGKRERMLDGELTRVGVGLATADDRTIHVVVDFER